MVNSIQNSSVSGLNEVHVADLSELAANQIKIVDVGGRRLGIVQTPEGVFALGDRCPHQGGPICSGTVGGTMLASDPDEYLWDHEGDVVKCPWHAYEFYIATGESVGNVVAGRIPVYETTVRDGQVYCGLTRVPPTKATDGAKAATP